MPAVQAVLGVQSPVSFSASGHQRGKEVFLLNAPTAVVCIPSHRGQMPPCSGVLSSPIDSKCPHYSGVLSSHIEAKKSGAR